MKKIIALILGFSLIFTLAGCGDATESSSEIESETSSVSSDTSSLPTLGDKTESVSFSIPSTGETVTLTYTVIEEYDFMHFITAIDYREDPTVSEFTDTVPYKVDEFEKEQKSFGYANFGAIKLRGGFAPVSIYEAYKNREKADPEVKGSGFTYVTYTDRNEYYYFIKPENAKTCLIVKSNEEAMLELLFSGITFEIK